MTRKKIHTTIFITFMLIIVASAFIVTRGITKHPISLIDTRAALYAMMPYLSRAHCRCHTAYRHHILRQVDTMYSRLGRSPDGDVIYPDFFGGMRAADGRRLVLFIVESRLDDAKAHEAFGPLLAEPVSRATVEFSFAQLYETQRQISTIIAERVDCIYAQNVHSYMIMPHENRVIVYFDSETIAQTDALMAGFKHYVYNSPMIDVRRFFNFPHSPRQFSPFGLLIFGFIVVVVLYFVSVDIKMKHSE